VPQVDGLADRGVDVALKRGLHPDGVAMSNLVGGGEHALDVERDVGPAADPAVQGDGGEQVKRMGEPALGGESGGSVD